jgi:hypothetical protein
MWPFGRKFKEVYVNGAIRIYPFDDEFIMRFPLSENDMKDFRENTKRGIKDMELRIVWKD